MDRAQLEQMALDKISKMQTVPSTKMDRAALEQMALQKLSDQGSTQVNDDKEASLGFGNRAKYSIEPLQSNRKALLEQHYGPDNVMDKDGELYIKQDGAFLPVNKKGFSVADVADFAGATPEMAGGIVGAGVGAMAGVPTGGTMSLPMAASVGAAGAGAGSVMRQGLSAAIGNPQVATPEERAMETGTSAALGGLFSGASTVAAPYVKRGVQGAKEFFKGAGKEAAKEAGESLTHTIAKTNIGLHGEMTPIKESAEEIAGRYADSTGREAFKNEEKKLAEISARQGIPEATYAQKAQGKALMAEAEVMETPLIGGKVRKQVDAQLKKIGDNLENITGKSIDSGMDHFEVGSAAKDISEATVKGTKAVAQNLYKKVEEDGANAMIGKRTFFNKFRDKAGDLGLINPDGTRAPYAADSSFTRTEFNKLQEVMFDGIDALKKNPSDKIRFEAANALRKTVKASAEEIKTSNPNAARLLNGFGKELDDTIEGTLNREHPKLGEVFRTANKTWAKYKNHEEVVDHIFRGEGTEKAVKHIMGDTERIKSLQGVIGDERVKEIGKSYVHGILQDLNKDGIGKARTALTAIQKNAPQIRTALGNDAYGNLVDNLHFLNRTGQSLGASRSSLYHMMFDQKFGGIKGFATRIAGSANTLAKSHGKTLPGIAKDKAIETTAKVVEKSTSNRSASGIANLLGDNTQRSLSYIPSVGNGAISENDKKSERRRAISGRK